MCAPSEAWMHRVLNDLDVANSFKKVSTMHLRTANSFKRVSPLCSKITNSFSFVSIKPPETHFVAPFGSFDSCSGGFSRSGG